MDKYKNNYVNIIIVFILIVPISLSTATPTQEIEPSNTSPLVQTLYVGGTGPNNYTKIQNAIDNASNQDTIFVYRGVYHEYLVINKEIRLIGETREHTIITGNYADNIIRVQGNNVTIMRFTVKQGKIGIYITYSSYFKITENTIGDNWEGIGLLSSSHGLISSNIIKNNDFEGINPVNSLQLKITANIIQNSLEGIFLHSSTYTMIYGNTIKDHIYGIETTQSTNNNKIYHNNFYGNDQSAKDTCTNMWDDGYPSGGNHWDDYTGFDNNGDGIGDTPYNIPGGGNKDRYPLMMKWNEPPYAPSNQHPRNHQTGVPTNPVLSVYVADPGEDIMDVSFFDASNHLLIGTVSNVPSFTTASISWNNLLNHTAYSWYAVADDGDNLNQSETWVFTVGESTNSPPTTPTITGPSQGKPKLEYTYSCKALDPDDDDLSYYIEWGDGTASGWLGPIVSGETLTVNHIFSTKGTYMVRAKVKDTYGLESDWGTLEVTIPKTISTNVLFMKFLERFSLAFPVLQHLLRHLEFSNFFGFLLF